MKGKCNFCGKTYERDPGHRHCCPECAEYEKAEIEKMKAEKRKCGLCGKPLVGGHQKRWCEFCGPIMKKYNQGLYHVKCGRQKCAKSLAQIIAEARAAEALKPNTAAENVPQIRSYKRCRKCIYSWRDGNEYYCGFVIVNHKSRGCDASETCERYVEGKRVLD